MDTGNYLQLSLASWLLDHAIQEQTMQTHRLMRPARRKK
jgi:hypothetical protein